MTLFMIEERVTFYVDGETAQDALDAWLADGEKAPMYAFGDVLEREVYTEDGEPCDVEDR